MESRGKITIGRYNNISAEIVYENNHLIFFTKSIWIRFFFGIIGEALASSKERFRINVLDIKSLYKSLSWTGKPVYELNLINDDCCKIVFSCEDELTEKLSNDLKEKLRVE